MSSIDAVIARARTHGGYSERKRFTIAKGRAIEKMRRFALADPYFYILELIQAAIANDAGYIEIKVDGADVTLAYVGGGLSKDDLANLFDYLFASKDRADIGHLRELALGINAALLFNPKRILVESGDGTLEGTTRLEMHGSHDTVDIGRPDQPLQGTFVRLEGMKKSNLPSGFGRMLFGESRPREFQVIESRCLAAPVPIILNGEALFGYAAQRTPSLLGRGRSLSFDEGDLYGTIALSRRDDAVSEFDLLTWGVLVQSKPHELAQGVSISGIVCFDRLRKTADHSGIVADERLDELWARLTPYVEQLRGGTAQRSLAALVGLDGKLVGKEDVRQLVLTQPTIVLVRPSTHTRPEAVALAAELGNTLEAPVFCGHPLYVPSLRAISGGKLEVVTADVESAEEIAFYRKAPAPVPARPWMTPTVEVEALETWKLMARLYGAVAGDEERLRSGARKHMHSLGTGERVHATVFAPEHTASADALHVELVTSDRLVWSGEFPTSTPGLVLRIELPRACPLPFAACRDGIDVTFGEDVAQIMTQHASVALSTAFGRAIASLAEREVVAGSGSADLALRAAARTCVPRLAQRDGNPSIVLDQIDASHTDLRDVLALRTLDGRSVSLRNVVELMNDCEGLFYGVVDGVDADLEGLDRSKILALDSSAERSLIALFGESTYVRIDARDVLASYGGVCCRDLAVGLREYVDHPLLVEQETDALPERELVEGLIERFVGHDPPAPSDHAKREDWQECRRHAARLLQRYVCEVLRRGLETPVERVFALPLFLDQDGSPCSVHEVIAAMQDEQGLALLYGHAYGGTELGALAKAATTPHAESSIPLALLASPWLHHCLARMGKVRVAFDFALQDAAPNKGDDWLASRVVEAPGLRGLVGIPKDPIGHPDIAVLLPEQERARSLTSLAIEHGCVGWVQLDASVEWNDERLEDLKQRVQAACERCLESVLDTLHTRDDPQQNARSVGLLLDYATRHLSLFSIGGKQPSPVLTSGLVDRVLSIPVFPSRHGEAMGAWRVVRLYCALFAEDAQRAQAQVLQRLGDGLAAHLRRWVERSLHESRVVIKAAAKTYPAPTPPQHRYEGGADTPDAGALHTTLLHWFNRLAPQCPGFPMEVWLHESEDMRERRLWRKKQAYLLDLGTLFVNPNHAAVSKVMFDPTSENLAWLLLGMFAHVNAELVEVENHHEQAFQVAVAKALHHGELGFLAPR